MEITSKVEGLRDLQKGLKSLGGTVERKISRSVVGKAGTILLKEARAKAPLGRTGALKRALTKRAKHRAKDDYYSTRIGVKSGVFGSHREAKRRGKGASYKPDEAVRYFRFLELGTKYHAAKPFLAVTIETKGDEVVKFLSSELGKQIEAAAKR